MEVRHTGQGARRTAPFAGGPTVEVLAGGDPDGPAVAVLSIEVPPGGGMPEHKHHGSDVVVMPQRGSVQITKGQETVEVSVGDAALVRRDESVAVHNPNTTPAQLLVAAGPGDFAAAVLGWPTDH